MKLSNFIAIISGLMILFFLAGLNGSVGFVLGTLKLASDATGLSSSALYTLIIGIITAGTAVGIGIGFLTKSPVENLLIVPAVLAFAFFLGDLLSIIGMANLACGVGSSCRWIYWVTVGIIAPMGLIFLMALIDWWRGRDS